MHKHRHVYAHTHKHMQCGSPTTRGAKEVLECNMKLVVVLSMLNGCFNPTKDQCTKIDMLS